MMKNLGVYGATMALVLMGSMVQAAGLSASDKAAAFKAAGFKKKGKNWVQCAKGVMDKPMDLNKDGLPEVLITEDGLYCHGNTATGFSLVSKQANGQWRLLAQETGFPNFLPSRHLGWPDVEVAGPGFCFSVLRWNGRAYKPHRYEYEGKPCQTGF